MDGPRYFQRATVPRARRRCFTDRSVQPSLAGAVGRGRAHERAFGLVAPCVLTHRRRRRLRRQAGWCLTIAADRRLSRQRARSSTALVELAKAVDQLDAGCAVIFRSPPDCLAPRWPTATRCDASSARSRHRRGVGGRPACGCRRACGIYRSRHAFANELGVLCAFDPLVRDPGQPPEVLYGLDVRRALPARGSARRRPHERRRLRSEPSMDDLARPRLRRLRHEDPSPRPFAFAKSSPPRWARRARSR